MGKLRYIEIENYLKDTLKKTKHIMTFGTIGSLNIDNDIDIIITKKPLHRSSDFFKEIHDLFDNLQFFLKKKYDTDAIRFSSFCQQGLINSFSKSKKKVMFHTMIYLSYSQMKKDWDLALFPDEDLKKVLESYNCLKGMKKDLFSYEFNKLNYCDNIFTYLYMNDLLQSKLDDKIILDSFNHLFDYLYRKRLKEKIPVIEDIEELKKYFYKLCDIADEKSIIFSQ